MRKVAQALATVWFAFWVATTLPIAYALARLMGWLGASRARVERFVNRWCHDYLNVWPAWRVTLQHLERLPAGPCVMVANHQSIVDVLAVMGLPKSFYFVSKASLFGVPIVGPMMRWLGHIALNRGHLESTRLMMERCSALLARGESVLIFPEGTYAPRGQRLKFRRGAFSLAHQHQVPLVPVQISGTAELVEGDGPWFAPLGHVEVTVHPPLPSEAYESDEALQGEVEGRFRSWVNGAASR